MLGENKGSELFRLLRTRIGSMPDGAEFPSVRRLMEEYGVSQATVTAGVRKLRELGLIESFVGRGTFVRRSTAETPPKILLLANDWPSRSIAEMIELLRDESLRRGMRFELRHFCFKEDICSKLNDFKADAIVIDGLSNDFLSLEQITRIHRCCVPVVISRSIVRVEDILKSQNDLTAEWSTQVASTDLRAGTVTFDVAKAVQELKAGRVDFKVDKAGVLHAPLGKVSFGAEKILGNLKALLETVVRLKPSAAKGNYLVSMSVSTTMGPGFKVDMAQCKKFIEG